MTDPIGPAEDSGAVLELPETSTGVFLDDVRSSGSVLVGSGTAVTGSGAAASTGSIVAPLLPLSASVSVSIRITEVAWMGSDRSTADEWVEIAAFGSGAFIEPRGLSGWTLSTVKPGVLETVIARVPDIEASSGSVFVIANYPAPDSRLLAEPAVVTTDMSLPNTQLLLRLRDGSGTLIDEVDDAVGAPFAGSNAAPKATMERIDPWRPGNVASNWKTATHSSGFDDGPPIFGTPGSLAPVPASPVAPDDPTDDLPDDPPVGVPVIPVQPPPALRLTEVLPNPAGADTDEWIEIGSFDPSPVDLSEVMLRVGTLRFGLGGTLAPGEHRSFGKILSGLPLANGGATVELLWRDKLVDSWTYGSTPEGVSGGRAPDGSVSPQCVPSPGLPNTGAPLDPFIHVQSSSAGKGKASFNLEARVPAGSMAGAVCSWAYPDGYANASCNPPSHAMIGPVSGDVILTLRDACGTTVIRRLFVDVPGKDGSTEDAFACTPTAFTGVLLSEVLPNPAGDEAEGEWIELANPTDAVKPLCGWSVDDEVGDSPYRLDRLQLHPGDRLVLPRDETGIAFANDRDAVRLTAPLPGGGSGAVEIVRFEKASEGKSYARRDDGAWLWTDPTPAEPNAFADARWPDAVLARIVGALPNPDGNDTDGGEWAELRNETAYPLPLTGWSLTTSSTSHVLDHVTLAPRERKRIALKASMLANTDGYVRLIDRDGVPVSLLAWEKSDDGRAVRPPTPLDVRPQPAATCSDVYGVDIVKIQEFNDLVSALIEKKKIDQEIYSNGASAFFVSGTDIASLLLRHGLAIVDHERPSPHHAAYVLDEREAREAKRGVWASEEYTTVLEESRTIETVRRTLRDEGLTIEPSHESGIVGADTALLFATNVPATIFVSVNSGAFLPYDDSMTLIADADVRVRAIADVQSASGTAVVTERMFSYALLRDTYPTLRISEIYPSPNKGETEWVELWNPSREPVRLLGWKLDDGEEVGSAPATLSGSIVLAAGERRIVNNVKIAWNNGGDTARLIAPNGRETHVVEYGAVKKGTAVAMLFTDDGKRRATCATVHPTPGMQNRCATPPVKVAKKKSKNSSAVRAQPKIKVQYRNLVMTPEALWQESALFAALRGRMGEDAGVGELSRKAIFGVLLALCIVLALMVARCSRHIE